VRYRRRLREAYHSVAIPEAADDVAIDACGYTGEFRRRSNKLTGISETEFFKILGNGQRLPGVIRRIREIDSEKNGFVTATELDDIFKLEFPELDGMDLQPLFRRYASI